MADAVVAGRKILAFLDPHDEARVKGWAVDATAPLEPLLLRVIIDGITIDVLNCGLERNDVGSFNLPSQMVGFDYHIPQSYQDGARHVLRFATMDGAAVIMSARTGAMPEMHFCLSRRSVVEGVLDGLVDGIIQGWALRMDQKNRTRTGALRILVAMDGHPVAEIVADQFRADVAEAMNADPGCGFAYLPPAELRTGKRIRLSFFVLPEKLELRGSPMEVIFPGDEERRRINALIARADELFAYAYHLRRELKSVLPGERFMLSDYPRFAAVTGPLARARAVALYGDVPDGDPLVSIVCPVFRPGMGAFLAAVDSVLAQSYGNWELLLVDDASGNDALTAVMAQLAARDDRIKILSLAENSGISAATNAAIAMASGAFIAFFDHDDVLHPDALDIMLRARAASGARLIYSDEDKIDSAGLVSEPHFKPDYNYRFLLEVNYICHFVMVEAALAKTIGPLNPELDGAQDHDFLLRAMEILQPGDVHHVAEVLYHWRKSEHSVAMTGAAKPLAANAGQRAVAAHLARRKVEANVELRQGLSCYRVVWKPQARVRKAVGVSILIPFRDHVEITRSCVEAIRKFTRDMNFEIILLDNWSTSQVAELFCVEQANLPRTRVIRIKEAFNYSRINNIGVRAARHEFVLFMNNDVFVKAAGWLGVMLDECLMDENVAGVGAKLLYQNGTVQHAGVVLGVGGIADHAFRGLAAEAPGYVMRAMAAQEISAVTAACMLVRKRAFEEVGGFDEAELTIAFNDVDLCIKLTQRGWRIIYTPDAVAEHRESLSRGDDLNETKVARFMQENEAMRQRYATILPHDPFYNQHFSREGGVYRELRVLSPGPRLKAPGDAAG